MTTHYGNFPILVPGTSQSMSRNGLQKTSGTILCRPGDEGQAYSMAQEFGSVFPDITTRTSDLGLVEVSFDAYQTNGSPTTLRGSLLVTLSKSFEGYIVSTNEGVQSAVPTAWTIVETWLVDTHTTFTTVKATATSAAIKATFPTLSQSMKRRSIIGRVGNAGPSSGTNQLSLTWEVTLTDFTRRNFGDIDEVDITYAPTATIE